MKTVPSDVRIVISASNLLEPLFLEATPHSPVIPYLNFIQRNHSMWEISLLSKKVRCIPDVGRNESLPPWLGAGESLPGYKSWLYDFAVFYEGEFLARGVAVTYIVRGGGGRSVTVHSFGERCAPWVRAARSWHRFLPGFIASAMQALAAAGEPAKKKAGKGKGKVCALVRSRNPTALGTGTGPGVVCAQI